MALTLNQTGAIALSRNQDAVAMSARITAGNIINQRVVELVKPQLPLMVKGYAETALGKAVIANAIASAMTHFMPGNEKVNLASQAMIESAMLNLVGSFNIEEMIDEVLSGVTLPSMTTEEA